MRNVTFHPEFMGIDFINIFNFLGKEKFDIFTDRFNKEIAFLHKQPIANTAPLTKPTLSDFNFRKLKFHSKVPEKGEKADMRIVYRYKEETNTLQFLAVGFRRSSPDVYTIAENRDNKDFVGL